jgi:hypothetical protein
VRGKPNQVLPASEVVRKDVPGKLKDVSSPSLGVPNILQRGDGHAPGSPMIMQRPQPIRVPEAAAVDPQPGRGGPPRRGRGRGRGAAAPRGGQVQHWYASPYQYEANRNFSCNTSFILDIFAAPEIRPFETVVIGHIHFTQGI